MASTCDHCGYENSAGYRFCGMCGAPLAVPVPGGVSRAVQSEVPHPPSTPPARAAEQPASAMELRYLLEDEEPKAGRWRLYVALVLLILAGALIWNRWRRQWTALQEGPSVTQAASQPEPTGVSKNDLATLPVATKPEAKAPEAVLAPAAETAPADRPETAAPGKKAADLRPEANSEPAHTAEKQPPTPSKSETTIASAKPPHQAAAKASPAVPKETVPTASRADLHFAEGQKYLYGDEVPQDCRRALQNLQSAARTSARAQSLLGAMYASGQCVIQDSAMAYRWFAKALNSDPGNPRYQQNVEITWRQMDAAQRQRAIALSQAGSAQ